MYDIELPSKNGNSNNALYLETAEDFWAAQDSKSKEKALKILANQVLDKDGIVPCEGHDFFKSFQRSQAKIKFDELVEIMTAKKPHKSEEEIEKKIVKKIISGKLKY